MPKNPILQQILLITDGCSNEGTDPVYIAQAARDRGITTSVIGILDEGSLGDQGRREAQNIAEAGGGMCRIVRAADLSSTMQMVTRQSMQLTLHQVVNAELRELMGQDANGLPPETRAKVARMVETLGEEMPVQLALVIDVSASMSTKMPSVKEAIRDLEFGLGARVGRYELTVITYPGAREHAEIQKALAPGESVADAIGLIRPAGNTPTGPALDLAVKSILRAAERLDFTESRPQLDDSDEESGSMRHYVI
ncbi:MAG: VWA domain-containing protein [Firmicutes bacterium]|nr:VWA domain-containing protein [Bacillota bacterium]